MGGRLCLALALERPDLIEQLVLVSTSPGIADPNASAPRAERADEQLAHDAERDGVDAFLDRWLAQPLFASLPRDQARLDERRRVNTVERITHQLRELGQGAQPSLWDRLGRAHDAGDPRDRRVRPQVRRRSRRRWPQRSARTPAP